MQRNVSLTLSAAETGHLAALGITADARGVLHSTAGRVVDAGTAALMLKDSMRPGDFDREYLRDGHQAERPAVTGGVPYGQHGAESRPASADASDGDDQADDDDARGAAGDGDVVDSAAGGTPAHTAARAAGKRPRRGRMAPPGVAAKAVDPEAYRRRYLAAGHSANSPGNTGMRETVPMPAPGPAEPQDWQRRWLEPGHQDESPGDWPGGNSPHPPGAPAGQVYGTAAQDYQMNRGGARRDQSAMTGAVTSTPAPARWSPPAGLGANDVPQRVGVGLTGRAPGEQR